MLEDQSERLAVYTDIAEHPIEIVACSECKRPAVKDPEILTDSERCQAYLRYWHEMGDDIEKTSSK